MERVILHSDLNNFYATVECLLNPELRNKPVAVAGSVELRHGIVLAKNYMAKQFNIKTGDTVWQAKNKCPELVVVPPDFKQYMKFSRLAHKIYEDYTDKIESFGIDECWLDVTDSVKIFGDGETIANEIRTRIKTELGLSASIGVSFNKIFAKLGSDLKKPDATTVINKENFKEKIFGLPVEDLLGVGKATAKRLKNLNINTIGKLANTDYEFLQKTFGKWGDYLHSFSNGLDNSPVKTNGIDSMVKSVGNSSTSYRDLKTIDDVKMMITVMSESVAERLREQGIKGQVVSLHIRNNKLETFGKQVKINQPTYLASEIIKVAMKLFNENFNLKTPLRSIGVSISMLSVADNTDYQLDFWQTDKNRVKTEKLEKTIDTLRHRFGHHSIMRGNLHLDKQLTKISPKQDNTIHPNSFF